MAVVTFDWTAFSTRYPELASVGQPLAQLYFDEATLYLDNTDSSPVQDVTRRAPLLNMVTAHIAKLNATLAGEAPSPLVGRITSAAQGSVNVQVEMQPAAGQMQAWFNQTRYGAAYWTASARYRRGFTIPACR